jgi:hypothetical protein
LEFTAVTSRATTVLARRRAILGQVRLACSPSRMKSLPHASSVSTFCQRAVASFRRPQRRRLGNALGRAASAHRLSPGCAGTTRRQISRHHQREPFKEHQA